MKPALIATALGALLAGCGERTPGPTTPGAPGQDASGARPTALEALRLQLLADERATRHPADGGGSARLVLEPGREARTRAGALDHWTIEYQAGPLGVAVGGAVYFMPEPFWGWSAPQVLRPRSPGFTRVETTAEGVEPRLEGLASGPGAGMLVITIAGRALRAGERITIHYGDGEGLARSDRYAERRARLWVAVDGDGDGVRALLPDSPSVEVLPGPPARLVLNQTSVAAPGGTVRLTAAVLDADGNASVEALGEVELLGRPAGWDIPATILLRDGDRGCRTIEFEAREEGVLRLRARLSIEGRELRAESNPCWVNASAAAIYWGDLHGHTGYSDGTGVPEDYFRYARDVAALDVIALTDHDHWGVRFLDRSPDLWAEIGAQTEAFREPGRFVTLLGYEWTNWIHGHRHVLYFGEGGEIHSSLDPEVATPRQLWDRLRGHDALTLAHHSSGLPVAVDWSFRPDPEIEPVTEIVSVHGSSEAADSPFPVRGSVPGNFVRDVLDDGVRLGFLGSGDTHNGHPGLAQLSPRFGYRPRARDGGGEVLATGGLAAIRADELSRAGILRALRARHVYATSGPRIVLSTSLSGRPMGSVVEASSLPRDGARLRVDVIATAELEGLDLIRSGEVRRIEAAGRELHREVVLRDLRAGEYVYVRVLQRNRGVAWSSPIFLE